MKNILKELKADKKRLAKKYKELGLDDSFRNSNMSKEWAAIHCQGVLTGFRLCLDKLKELSK